MEEPRNTFVESCPVILDSIEEGVATIDLRWRITSFNRAAETITGVSRKDAIGRPCLDVFSTNLCKTDCVLRKVLEENRPVFNKPVYFLRPRAKPAPISINVSILRDAKGRKLGGVETFRPLSCVGTPKNAFEKGCIFENMVSKNQKMLKIFSDLKLIANSQCTVLIEGATGTGKEMIARAVHNNSPQKNGPFVPVNCGALPDTLIESELFGYKAGAFTDARSDKPGRFERARNGTIFLDEIGDISPAMQVRLLRVLENKVYEPLGAVKPVNTNARIVVASHPELDRMVQERRFRKDLYFRINVMKLALPKLADREEDIPLLVNHFIKVFNRGNKKTILGLTQEAMAAFILYDWPGNIRELENAVKHAFVLCQCGLIGLQHLPEKMMFDADTGFSNQGTTLKEIEKNAIWRSLKKNNWKKMATARELGINKNTLRRKIVGYGIGRD